MLRPNKMTTQTTPKRLTLHFGQHIAWDIENSAAIASFLEPDIAPIDDVESVVDAALADPIEFPAMDQAVVAGDSLVFAVDPSLPALPRVLAGVLGFYHARGTSLDNMRIVLAGYVPHQAQQVAAAIQNRFGGAVPVDVHDPDDADSISYVAADSAAEAIYLNRRIVDADVVVPIMCGQSPGGLDDLGAFSLFPLLSNRTTIAKFYSLGSLGNPESHDELIALADQAAWWTGFMTAVQVIPAGGDQVGAVLAGATASVHQACRAGMSAAWGIPEIASDLTVALVSGDLAQQSWLAVARALHVGIRCTREGGALAICTDAELSIGQSMERLIESNLAGGDANSSEHRDEDSDNAIIASLIELATRDRHVYLVSKLPSEIVESLGMGVIQNPAELSRLIERSATCAILGSAQFRCVERGA